MSVRPEKLSEMVGLGPRHWVALAVLGALVITLFAFQWYSVSVRRRQQEVLSSLSFSYGLAIGQSFASRDELFSYLSERGFTFEREAEKGNYEFSDSSGALLLRVKELKLRVSAVYLFVRPGWENGVFGHDLLGLSREDLLARLGRPQRVVRRRQAAHQRESPTEAARLTETWFYAATDFDLTVGFDRNRRVVEVILQNPIGR
ncbi:MAG: hypothetical protein B1H03_05265 [Planctomycetales bacterium 4484_113]|nr:MAG: hypothetical protein B1H03_05265 [Planctomycetales bacterium 4484_113]